MTAVGKVGVHISFGRFNWEFLPSQRNEHDLTGVKNAHSVKTIGMHSCVSNCAHTVHKNEMSDGNFCSSPVLRLPAVTIVSEGSLILEVRSEQNQVSKRNGLARAGPTLGLKGRVRALNSQ